MGDPLTQEVECTRGSQKVFCAHTEHRVPDPAVAPVRAAEVEYARERRGHDDAEDVEQLGQVALAGPLAARKPTGVQQHLTKVAWPE